MTVDPAEITAIVLCGGRGSRMGDRDKPLLDYRGRPIIAHIIDALHPWVGAVIISANRNLEVYRDYGRVVEDQLIDHGPLSGIASCLGHCNTPYVFVCPGDAPNLDASMIQRLTHALVVSDLSDLSNRGGVAIANDGQRQQNLHLMMHAGAQPAIDAYLAAGARSVKGWLEGQTTVEVDCANIAASFADLDTPEDFDR